MMLIACHDVSSAKSGAPAYLFGDSGDLADLGK
jgi:hypothetical protein